MSCRRQAPLDVGAIMAVTPCGSGKVGQAATEPAILAPRVGIPASRRKVLAPGPGLTYADRACKNLI
jgi:hypothetical protein